MQGVKREVLLGKLVLVLSGATLEKLAAVYCFATGQPGESAELGVRSAESKCGPADGAVQAATDGRPVYVYRWTGRDWEVVFGGGGAFHLPNTLGARYLDYFVHEPNVPIPALDLEVAIQPEKGEARTRNSIQPESDARARSEYGQELRRLQQERQEAKTAGDQEKLERLESEVAALEAALKPGVAATDAGERARSNVRLAVRAVMARLEKGGPAEREFAEHLRTHLSLGYECLYTQQQGRIWG